MFRYIAFYKPYGVLSQFTSEAGHDSLASFGFPKDVYPVGRLDCDSEGLLLLSDDGVFIKKLLSPKFAHEREYAAQVEGVPTPDALRALEKGVVIKGYKTKPAKARLSPEDNFPPRDPPIRDRKNIPATWMRLTLTEGKNRQVRHMTAAVGFPTLRLIRVRIGKLLLDGMTRGQWRYVDRRDVV